MFQGADGPRDLGQVIAHAKAPADLGLLAFILGPRLASSRLPGGQSIGDPRLCALSLPADGTSPRGYPPTKSTPITTADHSWHRLGLVLGQRLDPIGQEASQGPHNQMLTRSPAPIPPMPGCVTHPSSVVASSLLDSVRTYTDAVSVSTLVAGQVAW